MSGTMCTKSTHSRLSSDLWTQGHTVDGGHPELLQLLHHPVMLPSHCATARLVPIRFGAAFTH